VEAQPARDELEEDGQAEAMSASGPPLSMLARPLRATERAAIARRWAAALGKDRTCELPATAFVSIYERGRVIGCVGHADWHLALEQARIDPRFGGARLSRDDATIQLSLLVRGPTITPDEIASSLELGQEGLVAFDTTGAIRAVLLPDVAADAQRDGAAMLRALLEKAGVQSADEIPRVMRVRRERFVARARAKSRVRDPIDAAAAWLAARVNEVGEVAHGIDARSGRAHRTGPFHLGRAAIVMQALDAHGRYDAVARRARAWLESRIEEGGEGLPKPAAERAGTLALALGAGVACRDALVSLVDASSDEIAESAWHAAQVVVALGREAPSPIVRAALAPIDAGTWAPWSALAADALGDRARARRARTQLARSIPAAPPHRGGVRMRDVPEVAITALVIEALAHGKPHHASVRRALAFLRTQQLTRDVSAALDPDLCEGAFPLAPHADFLRCDVTAHALLAMLATRDACG